MQKTTPAIEASAVVSVDGLIQASILPAEIEEDRISAMSAALLSLGQQMTGEMGRGDLEQIHIRGARGFILLTAIGEKAVLTTLAGENAKLGIIFHEMRRTAEDILKKME